ncbi:MAG: p-aminobenzoyl-glutamate transport protein [Verrucomicrobiota bacterium]
MQRGLDGIEWVGNALPNPATIFALLAGLVVLLSGVLHAVGVEVINPATKKTVEVVSLVSVDGLQRMVLNAVGNFAGFAPIGTVLVAILGIAVAESSGLIGAVLRVTVSKAPPAALTAVIVFAGIMSNVGSDVGYVLLIPLAGAIFAAVGRHPLAGIAAAFAGVSGGFSANLLPGTVDVLLAGITQESARVLVPDYVVLPTANYYFMAVATFLVTAIGTWITDRVIEPRLARSESAPAAAAEVAVLTAAERRGLWFAAGATVILTGLVIWGVLAPGTVPGAGFLLDPANPAFTRSVFMRGIVAFICVAGIVMGVAYGVGAGTIKNDHDIIAGMSKSMATMGSYLVLMFFCAQFVNYFAWTNLGTITAVKGAELLQASGLGPAPLTVAVILFTAFINLFIGSASAKWTLLGPVLVPMFMLVGYSPEFVQAAYRVGDSCTNIVTPLMAYFPLVLTFAQKYAPKAGIGTLISTMVPYSVAFMILWSLLLVFWIFTGWPLGPDAPMFITL